MSAIFSIGFDLTAFNLFVANVESNLQDISTGPMADAMQELADTYMSASIIRYGEQAQGGGEWPDISESRKKYKATHYPGTEDLILVASTHLLVSLNRGAPDYYEQILSDGLQFGTQTPYAMYHQGKRPILVSPDDPSMPSGLIDDMQFDLETGLKNVIAASIQP